MFIPSFVFVFATFFRPINSIGQTYCLTVMNITADEEVTAGFVQVLVFSRALVPFRVMVTKSTFQELGFTSEVKDLFFNATEDFVNNEVPISTDLSGVDDLGVGLYSSDQLGVVGVKSDRGSTDAFLSLRVVQSSKEFIIALWPGRTIFQGSIQIIGALNGTCVEVYKVFEGNKFVLVYSASINAFEVLRFFQRYKIDINGQVTTELEDLTGYYVNASRPVQVIVGHECGNVPLDVKYCDHMSEQIPPTGQLGTLHLVPPIAGRKLNAGYVIRIVAAQFNASTLVIVELYIQKVILFGQYVEVDIKNNMESVRVTCSTNCLVMQYNKGFTAVSDQDTPTDPFMMLVTPSDRFTNNAYFATPSYCDETLQRINFDNYMVVVTYSAYQGYIYYDEQPLSNATFKVQWTTLKEFSIASFSITHGFHGVSSTGGSFAAYVYGHSIMSSSPSAYGYAANFNITGESLSEGWMKYADTLRDYVLNTSSAFCDNSTTATGTIISSSVHASFPFMLVAEFQPIELSDNCRTNFQAVVGQKLEDVRQKINRWICLSLNCSYLIDFGVAVGNFSVSFVDAGEGKYSGININVDMIAKYTTRSTDFAQCRLEIRDYLSYFSNWLSVSDIYASLPNSVCPLNKTFSSNKLTVISSPNCKSS